MRLVGSQVAAAAHPVQARTGLGGHATRQDAGLAGCPALCPAAALRPLVALAHRVSPDRRRRTQRHLPASAAGGVEGVPRRIVGNPSACPYV
jgi:hypothetical protein